MAILLRSDYDTPWVIKFGEKKLENLNTPFLSENIPSPHQVTLVIQFAEKLWLKQGQTTTV